jgi:hypothetical protein
MKLFSFPARVNFPWQVLEQPKVILSSGKAPVEFAGTIV